MMIDTGMLFVIIFIGLLILTVVCLVLWHVLHFVLTRKYDELLFKEPIFNQMELAIYSAWPLSLVRTMAYVLLIAAPNFFITKRRFKEVRIDRSNIYLLKIFSRLFLLVVVLGVLFVVAMVIMGIASYLPGAGQSS